MNAAGASVLLSSMLGLSLSFGSPVMAPPLRSLAPQYSTMSAVMNPVEQLADSDISDITEASEVASAEVEQSSEIEGGGFDPLDEVFELEKAEEDVIDRTPSSYPDGPDRSSTY